MTDQEILAVAHRTASTYRHRSEPESSSYGFMNHTILDFARKIEQAAAADERERCARACESIHDATVMSKYARFDECVAARCAVLKCADAIRKGTE